MFIARLVRIIERYDLSDFKCLGLSSSDEGIVKDIEDEVLYYYP